MGLLDLLIHPIFMSKSANITSAYQASFNTACHPGLWPGVKTALFFYTTGIIIDDFYCCFVNVLDGG